MAEQAAGRANPFYVGNYSGHPCYTVDAADRIRKARDFTAEQCRAALALPDLQKGVVTALNRRLGLLKRQGKA